MKTQLTPRGQDRREQIKAELSRRLPSIRRNHIVRTRLALATTVVLAVAIGIVGWQMLGTSRDLIAEQPNHAESNRSGTNGGDQNPVNQPITQPERPSFVKNSNPSSRPSHSKVKIELISDDELLKLLSAAGRPSVLGRIDGKLVVLPAKAHF